MSKDKNISGKVFKSALTGRLVKNPAKSGSIQPIKVERAVKKVASLRKGK